MRIVMTASSVADMFEVEVKHVRLWTRLGVLPVVSGPPYRYSYDEMQQWIADGNLNKHKPLPKTEYKHEAGFWVR